MKQTAVDWLFNRLWETPKDKMVWYYILEKAKQIEKEQIKDAVDYGAERFGDISEQYYKVTYEK